MAIVFASNDAADFGSTAETHTDSTFFDSAFVSRGFRTPCDGGGTNPFGLSLVAPVSGDFWLHFRMSHTGVNSGSDGVFLSFMDSSGDLVAEFPLINGSAAARAYGGGNTTGTYAHLGSSNAVLEYDIKVSVGASVSVEFYLGGALVSSATNTNSAGLGAVQHITFNMHDFGQLNGFYHFSEFMVADGEPTLGLRLAEMVPSTDGTYTDGVGTTASLADGNAATGVVMGTAGDKRSWNPAAYSGPASPTIHSVVSVSSVRIGGGDVTSARQFLRIGGTDYLGADKTPAKYVGNITEQWAVNPATGLPWTASDLSTFEAGIEARP